MWIPFSQKVWKTDDSVNHASVPLGMSIWNRKHLPTWWHPGVEGLIFLLGPWVAWSVNMTFLVPSFGSHHFIRSGHRLPCDAQSLETFCFKKVYGFIYANNLDGRSFNQEILSDHCPLMCLHIDTCGLPRGMNEHMKFGQAGLQVVVNTSTKICQIERQKDCQKICQNESQKTCQMMC